MTWYCLLRELCAIAEDEVVIVSTQLRRPPNDGKRAAALIERVVEGGPSFWSDYSDVAGVIALEVLDRLAREIPTPGTRALLKALVEPLLAVERRQVWSDEKSIGWRKIRIQPGVAAWSARERVLNKLRAVLQAASTPLDSRVSLWGVYSTVSECWTQESLQWVHEVLSSRSLDIAELAAARSAWKWRLSKEQNPEISAAADSLESLYLSDSLAREFQPLVFGSGDWNDLERNRSAKGSLLAQSICSNDIWIFLERAERFFGEDHSFTDLGGVAWSLGADADTHDVVRQFVFEALGRSLNSARLEFVIAVVVSWVGAVRRISGE